jgi:hypothetical protein
MLELLHSANSEGSSDSRETGRGGERVRYSPVGASFWICNCQEKILTREE